MADKTQQRQECVHTVACTAVNCIYNDNNQKRCVAEKITVGGYDSTRKTDTFCATFTDKK